MRNTRAALRALVSACDSLQALSDTAAADHDVAEAMQQARAALDVPDVPAAIWLVYVETNEAGEPEIIGAYDTHQKALDAQEATQAARMSEGRDVYAYPTTDDNNDLWDVDVHVEELEIE